MPRGKGAFVCKQCGYVSPGWMGRCPACGCWNTIVEQPFEAPGPGRKAARAAETPIPLVLAEIEASDSIRIDTGLSEFDRVLGGGFVPGSVVLVGGEPGVGKSTLLLQTLLALENRGIPVLLVSGEESASQVRLRSLRLGGESSRLAVLTETQTELVAAALERLKPSLCVVDSVQTLWSREVGSVPGSVAQVREATAQLLRVAKDNGIVLVLVGHVTKDGELAGPRVLEHLVDAVISFEGERVQPFRILRAVKNRFGSTNEVGVFQMSECGLVPVPDPSGIFMDGGDLRSGSVVVPVLEGSRCLLAEVQALVAPTSLAVPQRVARGVDRNRLAMVVAVLCRRARVPLFKYDIFVNVAGGLALEDPAADLGVALAVAAAWKEGPGGQGVAAFGEVSLTGTIRYAAQGGKRIQELARRGFTRVFLPVRNAEEQEAAGGAGPGASVRGAGPGASVRVELEPVDYLEEAVKKVTTRRGDG